MRSPRFILTDAPNIVLELRMEVKPNEPLLEEIRVILCQEQSEQSQHRNMKNVRSEVPHLTSALIPSQGMEGVDPLSPVSPRIRTVQASPGDNDVVSRMRNARLGRLYRDRLKQYIVVRWVARWIWRNLFPMYISLSLLMTKRYPLTKLSEFAKQSGIPTYKLADAELVETPQPKVFPVSDQSYLVAPHCRYTFPELFIATINNAITYGGTNLVLADGKVVCHDLYDFERDSTSEELNGRTLIAPKSRRIRFSSRDKTPELIPVAATFVDACAPNYAHWMTEVLPRVALFCAEKRFNDVPIVVDEGLHHNIMESLFLVAGAGREVITLPIGRALAVNELYLTSVAGYVPFERRAKKLSGHSHGMFSPRAFEKLRKHLGALAQKTEKGAWPEKIFLRRISGTRKVTNTAELEELLVAQGYVIVEPEKLSFLQQMQLFSKAKVIVGSSGAALANILFAPQGAKIIIFISKYPGTSYWYWQNIACASGKRISYIFGEVAAGDTSGIHAEFTIDLPSLAHLIDEEE